MKAWHGSGGHRPPPRWQVTVMERLECPVRRTPSGSFRASATSANQLARVARQSRGNGHTAIAGGRCLDAGIMPPPRSRSITGSSFRPLNHVRSTQLGLADLRTCGLADFRTNGSTCVLYDHPTRCSPSHHPPCPYPSDYTPSTHPIPHLPNFNTLALAQTLLMPLV
jgi:hypothetical protein